MEQLTITQNFYWLKLMDIRKLYLNDLELVEVLEKSCLRIIELFEKSLVFPSLSGENLMVHLKSHSYQSYDVKLDISSECCSQQPRNIPKVLPRIIKDFNRDSTNDLKLMTSYSLGIIFLQLLTDNPRNIYNYDVQTLLSKSRDKYPFITQLLQRLLYQRGRNATNDIQNVLKRIRDLQQQEGTKSHSIAVISTQKRVKAIKRIQFMFYNRILEEFNQPRKIANRLLFYYLTGQNVSETHPVVKRMFYSIKTQESQEKSDLNRQSLLFKPSNFHMLAILLQLKDITAVDKHVLEFKQLKDRREFTQKQLERYYHPNRTASLEDFRDRLINRYTSWLLRMEAGQQYLPYCQSDPWLKLRLLLTDKKYPEALTEADRLYSQATSSNPSSQLLRFYEYDDRILILNGLRHFSKSLVFCNKSLELKIDLFGKESLETTYSINITGFVLFQLQKFKESKIYVDAGINFNLALKGPDNPELVTAYNNIAILAISAGDFQGSLMNHHHVLEIKREQYSSIHPEICMVYNNIASVYQKTKKYTESIEYFKLALQIFMELPPTPSKDLASTIGGLASVYQSMQNHEVSIALGHLAYHLRYLYLSTTFGGNANDNNSVMINEEQAAAMDNISMSFLKLNRRQEALQLSQKSNFIWIELLKKTTIYSQQLINNVNAMAKIYRQLDRLSESYSVMNNLASILQKYPLSQQSKDSFYQHFKALKIELAKRIIQNISDAYSYIAINMHDKALVLLQKNINILDAIVESKLGLNQGSTNRYDIFSIRAILSKISDKLPDDLTIILPYVAFQQKGNQKRPILIMIPKKCLNINNIEMDRKKEELLQMKINEIEQNNSKDNENNSEIDQDKKDGDDEQGINQADLDMFIQNNQQSVKIFKKMYNDLSYNQLLIVLLIITSSRLLFEGVVNYEPEFQRFMKEITSRMRQIVSEHTSDILRDIGLMELNNSYRKRVEVGGISGQNHLPSH